MINLLLLSCGTNACYHIAKTLKSKFKKHFRIIGLDVNENYLVPSIHYLDKFYRAPYSIDSTYYNFVLDICKIEKINIIIPSFDTDQKLFYPENKDLKKLNVISLSTSEKTLSVYDNKKKMNDFLEKSGFPIPKRYSLQECNSDDLYMVKPINGVGSIDAKLRTKDEISLLNLSNFIIQEKCEPPEITMECFYFNKKISTICRQRITTKAGVCTKAFIFHDKDLESIGERFAEILETPYIFNLQFMKNKLGKYVITDVNLRTAGGMSLSYIAGWDEISALAKIILGITDDKKIFKTLPKSIPKQYVVRCYKDIVTHTEKTVIAFDFDGTLLDSRKRHKIVMDFVLNEFNIDLDTSNLVEFKSRGKNNIDFLLSKGLEKNLANKIQKRWIEKIESPQFLKYDVLYPDTISLLKNSFQNNDLILITSRTNFKGLQSQIDRFHLRSYFKEIFIIPPGKEIANEKAKILINQKAILMYGDTSIDSFAAQIAGIQFKFRKNGFHKNKVSKKEQ